MNTPVNILRKIPKWVRIVIIVLIVLLVIGYFAVGYYFSSKLLHVTNQTVDYDQTVTAIEGDSYTLSGDAYDIDGIVGYIKSDGTFKGTFSAPTAKNDTAKTSVRKPNTDIVDKPVVGEKLSLQGNIWTSDPHTALGIDYTTVQYDSPLGKMNAWEIPSTSPQKWTIAVHGIGAEKTEMLRFVKAIKDSGNTALVINYRNDNNSPRSPDGYTHLGDTEWQDLEAAVQYAKAHGATDISLYGSSLGGSITENYLRRSSDVANTNISHVVLDSPALDWNEILNYRVTDMGYPAFISKPGKFVAGLRSGIDFDRITTKPGSIKQPTLLIHNADDQSVPQAASKRLAQAQPDKVTFVDFGSGGHIRAWNHDSAKYNQLVTDFLKQ